MSKGVRVRFAPSPTGPLHIGGVRTALYNYLFAQKHNGTFILRIEDTDQTRYVSGAEAYIIESLNWLGLIPAESVDHGGDYGPYRQSERRDIYTAHVEQLIEAGHAYYAFDTPVELEEMREREKANGKHSPKYDASIRMTMRNSLTLSDAEVQDLIEKGENVTVRMKVPEGEVIGFSDEVRGRVQFDTSELDDKVILKADGLPTYHLANVVDDRLMEISHVIRGEEWLSSTAHHVLLYRFFGWEAEMPVFTHLPLIMKPSGKGKLSKRDGAKFGFPVFPLEWNDEKEGAIYAGFREEGFLPDALINFLSLLGWSPGTDQEMFTRDELAQEFSIAKIIKSGAQFNYDKAKWFNQQYIIASPTSELLALVADDIKAVGGDLSDEFISGVIDMLKPRVESIGEFVTEGTYFWSAPTAYEEKPLKKKFKLDNQAHFEEIISALQASDAWDAESLSALVKGFINDNGLKFGEILPVLRICMTGSMAGPDLFEMIALLGKEETVSRLQQGLKEAIAIKTAS